MDEAKQLRKQILRNKRGQIMKGNKPIAGFTSDSKYWLGKKLSEEHKRNMVEVRKKNGTYIAWNKGIKKPPSYCKRCNKELYNRRSKFCRKCQNLGKKHSEETKRKISKNRRGKKCGIESHLWKGGITPINAKIRTSIEYKDWRMSVFIRDNFTCQICEEIGGKLNAHHIKSFSKFPELRFDINNGITLCHECHKKTDNYGRPTKN